MTQKIIPYLWFQQGAPAAAEFYAAVFPDGKVEFTQTLEAPERAEQGAQDTPKAQMGTGDHGASEIASNGQSESNQGGNITGENAGNSNGTGEKEIRSEQDGNGRGDGEQDGNGRGDGENSANSTGEGESNGERRPAGGVQLAGFQIMGYSFMAIGAPSPFVMNPAISAMVNFDKSRMNDAAGQMDAVWDKLVADGEALMPLDKYPFSERYGWVRDKFGFTWQLILTEPEGEDNPLIVPALLFVGDLCGRAKEASDFYLEIFKHSRRGALATYPADMPPNKEGDTMFTDFMLEQQWFAAMDGAGQHDFGFNEAVSLMVNCQDQAEIDYYWARLLAGGGTEQQCGWLKDKFGISWQIIPANMGELLGRNPAKTTPAMMSMKKIIIADLEAAGSK